MASVHTLRLEKAKQMLESGCHYRRRFLGLRNALARHHAESGSTADC